MEKKNPFKFTLGFDKTKASHIRAVELLNSVKDKADLIAEAIVAHVDGIQESNTFSNEVLQAIIQETVRQEVHKAMQSNSMEKSEKEPEITMTFPEGTKDTIDPRVVENVRNAMSAFRRREHRKEAVFSHDCFFLNLQNIISHRISTGSAQFYHRLYCYTKN